MTVLSNFRASTWYCIRQEASHKYFPFSKDLSCQPLNNDVPLSLTLIYTKLNDMTIIWHQLGYLTTLLLCVVMVVQFANGQEVALSCDPCIERTDYRIKAIVHGTSGDGFWQRIRSSAMQAAKDMRVNLDFQLNGK